MFLRRSLDGGLHRLCCTRRLDFLVFGTFPDLTGCVVQLIGHVISTMRRDDGAPASKMCTKHEARGVVLMVRTDLLLGALFTRRLRRVK